MQTKYDGLGRVYQVSNPYLLGSSPSYWTTTSYDGLSRVIQVTAPDGSNSYTGYSGNVTTVVDQAGKWRQTTTDAAGRLIQVVEDPAASFVAASGATMTNAPVPPATQLLQYTTTYTYDALDDLLGVNQSGQTRTFAYDGAKRLICAQNPESSAPSTSCASLPASGVDRYTYDANGNLNSHTNANGISTSSVYDKLNRPIQKTYSDGTPAESYCYDGSTSATSATSTLVVTCTGAPSPPGPYSQRRLTWESNGVSSNSFSGFDKMGRVVSHTQTTGGTPYSFQYAYNVGGEMEWEQYPSGRQVTSGFDVAGRAAAVSGSMSGVTTPYASGALYGLDGQMTSASFNNGLIETRGYSPDRLQLTSIQAGTLTLGYDFGTNHNNGNVRSSTITHGGYTPIQAFYTYDALNRLLVAAENPAVKAPPSDCTDTTSNWCEQYDDGAFGNRRVAANNNLAALSATEPGAFNAANNHISGGAWTYDAAGNVIGDPGGAYAFDAQNRMKNAMTSLNTIVYGYGADGRRVMKTICPSGTSPSACFDGSSGAVTTRYAYDAMGALTAEYKDCQNPAACVDPNQPTGTVYLTADMLGSTRQVVNAQGGVVECVDYLPFGDFLPSSALGPRSGIGCYGQSQAVTQLFTGKERDAELASSAMAGGLDYFGARYFSAAQGRFTSPDEPFADQHPEDPQSWNMYGYVRNNPIKNTDPDGRDCTDGFTACLNYIIGGLNGILNTPSNLATGLNRGINALTGWHIPDAPRLPALDENQRQGEEAVNAVMLVSPLAELGAAKAPGVAAEIPLILQNAAKGKAAQEAVAAETALTETKVVQNLTLQTQSGTRTVMDVVSTDASGNVALREVKSSATAPLTSNQVAAHPEIGQTGATVMGKGKPGYPGGTQIPPTQVQVVRPTICPGGPGCQ